VSQFWGTKKKAVRQGGQDAPLVERADGPRLADGLYNATPRRGRYLAPDSCGVGDELVQEVTTTHRVDDLAAVDE